MPEIKVEIKEIQKLELKAKIVEEKEEGEIVDRRVVTAVKFEYDGTPLMLNQVLLALANGHRVSAAFHSPQSIMSMNENTEEKEPAGVS